MKSTMWSGARLSSGSHSGASTRRSLPRIGFGETMQTQGPRLSISPPPVRHPCKRRRKERIRIAKEDMMGKIVVTEFISLDGVIQDPGGSEDYSRGGWAFDFDRGAEGDRFKLDELFEAEAQLLGRVTYEGFAAAWPEREDEAGFAKAMNEMPKYVVSTT